MPIHFILITLSAFLLNACSRNVQPQSNGRSYFVGYGCNTCHRVGDEGGILGPDLTTIGFRKSPEWLDLWLKDPNSWKKNSLMPNFYFPENTRKELVAYLSSLKGQDYKEGVKPWDHPQFKDDPVKRGEVLFERVGCIGCHGKAGAGGYPNNNVMGGQIPSLTKVADGYSKEELKDRIRKGVFSNKADPNGPEPMIFMPKWDDLLTDDELDSLVEYLYSLRPPVSEEEAW